jgi:hypothetical protein
MTAKEKLRNWKVKHTWKNDRERSWGDLTDFESESWRRRQRTNKSSNYKY